MFKYYPLVGDECDIKMILLFYIHPKIHFTNVFFLPNTFANCAIRKSEVFLCLKTELLLDDTVIKDSFLVYCFILVELFYK
jgi:hypothetical protein